MSTTTESRQTSAAAECQIDGAVYLRTVAGLAACLLCDCGFVARGETWEEAGAEMDEHLEPGKGDDE